MNPRNASTAMMMHVKAKNHCEEDEALESNYLGSTSANQP